jgi:hypothetical protein
MFIIFLALKGLLAIIKIPFIRLFIIRFSFSSLVIIIIIRSSYTTKISRYKGTPYKFPNNLVLILVNTSRNFITL